jgi:hypothetical protein
MAEYTARTSDIATYDLVLFLNRVFTKFDRIPLFAGRCGGLSRLNYASADRWIGDLSECPQKSDALLLSGEACVIIEIFYQQNGKILAIRQFSERLSPLSTRFRFFFGAGATVSALELFWARRRFDSLLCHRYPMPNSNGLAF